MKHIIHLSISITMLAGMTCISHTSVAAPSDCEEVFFSPHDFNHEHPLLAPHPEFMKSYKLAKSDHAVEQRNIAVSYDAGYLVKACPEKAYYWYQKAADNGDPIAKEWLGRHYKLKALHDGPEFFMVAPRTNPTPAMDGSGRTPGISRETDPTKIASEWYKGAGDTRIPAPALKVAAQLSQGINQPQEPRQ